MPNGLQGRSRRQVLALFGFVVLAFVVLAYRTETITSRLQHQEQQRDIDHYTSCLGGIGIIKRFNAQQQALADIERSQTINPTLAARRIDAYERAIVQIPANPCGKDPRK